MQPYYLLPLYVHVNEVFAADSPDTIHTDKEHHFPDKTNVSLKGSYEYDKDSNSGTFTADPSITEGDSIILVQNNGQLTIQGLNNLNFASHPNETNPAGSTVWAAEGTTVNIGTEDNK